MVKYNIGELKMRAFVKAYAMNGILINILLFIVIAMPEMENIETILKLRITAWNLRSMSCAKPYIKELLQCSDILAISEHRLYPSELYKLNDIDQKFDVLSKSSSDLNENNQSMSYGHGGVALFWRKSLSLRVTEVSVISDRICAIEIVGDKQSFNVTAIGVYMPQSGCKIAKFGTHSQALNDLVKRSKENGEVIMIGDFNSHFNVDYGERFWESTSQNAKDMLECILCNNMVIIDVLSQCKGPDNTFNVDNVGRSYTDHIIGTKAIVNMTVKCEVIKDCV